MGKRKWFDKWIKFFFLFGCGLMLAFFLYGEYILPEDNLFSMEAARIYQGTWVQKAADGTESTVIPPCRLKGGQGETVTIQTVLPETVDYETVMVFHAVHQSMRFYIDGEFRGSHEKLEEIFFTDYPVRAYIPLRFQSSDAGKLLTVEVTGYTKQGTGTLYPVYVGSMNQVLATIVGTHLPRALLAMVLILIAGIGWIICMILSRMMRRKIPMAWLCAAVFMMMSWILTDSPVRQFLFRNTAAAASLAYLIMLLAPVSFFIYLDLVQKQRYHRIYQGLELLSGAAFLLGFALNLLGVDFVQMSTAVYGLLLFIILVCGGILIYEQEGGYLGEYKFVAAGMGLTVVAGIVEVGLLILGSDTVRQITMGLAQLAFVILASFQTVSDIRQSLETEKEKAEESDRAREELAVGLSEELLPLMKELDEEVLRIDQEEGSERSKRLRTGMGQAMSFLISLRDLSSLQAGVHDTPQPYNMQDFAESARSFLEVRTRKRGLEGELVLDDSLPEYLVGSQDCSKYAFINLVEYAVCHADEGEVVASISLQGRRSDICLELSVAASGAGLSRELAEKLENPDPELSLSGDIRLLSVRQMVLSQGGEMRVESVEQAGFLITVLLPQSLGEIENEAYVDSGQAASPAGTEFSKPKPREPLITPAVGVMYCSGSEELYQEVLAAYVKEGERQQENLRACVEREDWENYRILVHAIKSTSLNIGAEALSKRALRQEDAAREGRTGEILEGWEPLSELYGQVIDEARALLGENGANQAPEKEDVPASALCQLETCLEDYDMEAALGELSRLEEEQAVPAELLMRLREAVEDFDYDEARVLIASHQESKPPCV